jgi:hypothetical protein
MKYYLFLLFTCFSLSQAWGQKFHFTTSMGSSYLAWVQGQQTLNTGAQLQFQKPGKPTELFGQVHIIGNLQSSMVDGHSVTFRGGKAEIGLNQHMKSGLFSSASIYSISLIKKTSASKGYYLSEEKFAMHGLKVGIGYQSHGKIKTTSQIKLFEPLIRKVSMQTRGADQVTDLPNQLGYQASFTCKKDKWGLGFDYEKINYGEAFPALQVFSTQLTYFF